jgi:hypothetical protein
MKVPHDHLLVLIRIAPVRLPIIIKHQTNQARTRVGDAARTHSDMRVSRFDRRERLRRRSGERLGSKCRRA